MDTVVRLFTHLYSWFSVQPSSQCLVRQKTAVLRGSLTATFLLLQNDYSSLFNMHATVVRCYKPIFMLNSLCPDMIRKRKWGKRKEKATGTEAILLHRTCPTCPTCTQNDSWNKIISSQLIMPLNDIMTVNDIPPRDEVWKLDISVNNDCE